MLLATLAGWAYWSAGSAVGGNGGAAAASVGAGMTPTGSVDGESVTLNWAASSLSNGQPVDGYVVKRYDAGTLATQTILTRCTGTVAVTTCIEDHVPVGSWVYTVTPKLATNWLGAESAKSATLTVTPADPDSPPVTIDQAAAQADPTNASPINFTVVFYEAVTGFATGDVTFSGTAGGTKVGTVTGSGTTYNVAVTGMTGQGTVVATIAAGVAFDLSGNPNHASTSIDNTVTRDTLGSTVNVNQAVGQADPAGAAPINFTVVFSETTTTFATGDVTFTGTAAGTKVGTVTGSGTTYNVAVSGMTSNGTVVATVAAGAATDAAGNSNTASTSTDNSVTLNDVTSPTVTINQAVGQADPTSALPINFTVAFSEAVSGFATGDVTFTGGGPGGKTGTVTGSGTTYNVAVTGTIDQGPLTATITPAKATDLVGNTNTASTSTDNTVTRDTTGPTVTIAQAVGQADPASASPVNFTVVFNETVSGFDTGDVTFTGTATGTKVGTVTGSGTTYNVAVSGMTGNGTVIAAIGAGVATDAAGNANNASGGAGDRTVTFTDTLAPTVTINQAAGQADPTNASPINFTVVFSETVTGFATGDITFTGTTGGTKVGTVTGSGTTYSVAVTGMTGQGTVIPIIAAGRANDLVGNANTASTSTDNTVTRDTLAPTVTINQAAGQADPTGTTPVNFTVVFSQATTTFATGDVTFIGTAGATTGTVTGSGTTYNVAASGMTGNGTVVPTVSAGAATDAAGNANTASTSTDNSVTFSDVTAPTVTINQAGGQADPTNASPINFTVVFSETVTGFATGDITFTGTTGGTKVGTVTGSGTTYNVAVTGMTGQGTVVPIIVAGRANDVVGNANTASTSTDNTVTLDTVAPTVTINQAAGQADPTSASTVNFTVVFSETVTGFATGDITFTGTAGATTGTVTGSGTTYNVAATGMTGAGTVVPIIAAAKATDPASNANTASTSTDNSVTYSPCTPGSSTVIATQDAWVDEKSPGTNKGTDSVLNVQSKNGNNDNRVLVKFTLPVIPAGCSMTSATLGLYNNSPVGGRTIDVYRAGASWLGNTVTWTNQPATTGTAVGVNTTPGAGLQQWVVTGQVQTQYAGTNDGFILKDRTESEPAGPKQAYASMEAGSNKPQLVINWS